jgi:hypothetical protein
MFQQNFLRDTSILSPQQKNGKRSLNNPKEALEISPKRIDFWGE